jgi:hypothetical protein
MSSMVRVDMSSIVSMESDLGVLGWHDAQVLGDRLLVVDGDAMRH